MSVDICPFGGVPFLFRRPQMIETGIDDCKSMIKRLASRPLRVRIPNRLPGALSPVIAGNQWNCIVGNCECATGFEFPAKFFDRGISVRPMDTYIHTRRPSPLLRALQSSSRPLPARNEIWNREWIIP